MDSCDFYTQILGINNPWFINDTSLEVEKNRVDIYLKHSDRNKFLCPECKENCPVYDHSPTRVWRHLDTCQMHTYIHAELPRINCNTHGIKQAKCDWAEDNSRYTLLMEKFVLSLLSEVETVSSISKICCIGWHAVFGMMSRYMMRNSVAIDSYPTKIGIDEKAILKGHKYMTIIYDLEKSNVIHIIEGRKKKGLLEYLKSIPMKHRKKIESISMDMWPAYYEAVMATIPNAKDLIVFDKFHIMQYLNKAVDNVRKEEHRKLLLEGDKTLAKTKFHWFYNPENIPKKIEKDFDDLCASNLKTSRAWHIKEMFRPIFEYEYYDCAKEYFSLWFGKAKRSKLKPVKKVADTLKRHEHNILTYCFHRITNGKAEAINSRIMTIKRKARGHRNFDNLKTLIMFYLGENRLNP